MNMRGQIRATAVAAVLGAAALLSIPTASAAPAAATAECTTKSDTRTFGRGDISICVQDGRARVTGNVEDLLPGGGLGGPDGGCVTWNIYYETASGVKHGYSPWVCGHFMGTTYVEFDFDPAESEGGPQDITGVQSASLGTVWM